MITAEARLIADHLIKPHAIRGAYGRFDATRKSEIKMKQPMVDEHVRLERQYDKYAMVKPIVYMDSEVTLVLGTPKKQHYDIMQEPIFLDKAGYPTIADAALALAYDYEEWAVTGEPVTVYAQSKLYYYDWVHDKTRENAEPLGDSWIEEPMFSIPAGFMQECDRFRSNFYDGKGRV